MSAADLSVVIFCLIAGVVFAAWVHYRKSPSPRSSDIIQKAAPYFQETIETYNCYKDLPVASAISFLRIYEEEDRKQKRWRRENRLPLMTKEQADSDWLIQQLRTLIATKHEKLAVKMIEEEDRRAAFRKVAAAQDAELARKHQFAEQERLAAEARETARQEAERRQLAEQAAFEEFWYRLAVTEDVTSEPEARARFEQEGRIQGRI
jgi:hypothetical protein